MRDIKSELQVEKEELDAKILKLSKFLDTLLFASLPKPQQRLLIAQKGFMGSYSRILGERIQQIQS
jgi:hypothetical protein